MSRCFALAYFAFLFRSHILLLLFALLLRTMFPLLFPYQRLILSNALVKGDFLQFSLFKLISQARQQPHYNYLPTSN